MKYYIIYNSTTNQPKRFGNCQDMVDVNLHAAADEYALEVLDTSHFPVLDTSCPFPETESRLQAIAVNRKLFFCVLNLENRIRTLEGRPTITAAQLKNFLEGL